MIPWRGKKEKIPTVADHPLGIAGALNSLSPPPPPVLTHPIMAQVKMQMGISGAGPSSSNPQGSVIAKEDKEEIGQEKGQEDIGQVLPRRQRGKWKSTTASIGQDQAFKEVCDFLRDDKIGMVGIYGRGGVGKTTLLEKICEEYLKPSNFKVIWIVVSKSRNVDSIKKDVMKKMDLAFDPWEHPYHRAEQISNSLDANEVALLFDDIGERLDLKELGILGPTGRNTSITKIIFTTRSEKVCNQMDPDKQIKVECLGLDDSWALFKKSVGREALESDYDMENMAKEIAKECKGLPLALTVIGRVMKSKKDRHHWKYALRRLRESNALMENPDTGKQLFAHLELSYDALPDNGEKNCFLYCCLFPEDEKFEGDQLTEYWIAEGFLALSGSYLKVSKRGVDIIGTLQAACLLERADGDMYVKMHDVVRDMGLWIASKLTWNFFIHGGSQLIKSEVEEKWREAHRIYVLRGDGFPEQPLCLNLTTLIIDLAARERIKIWNSFFNSMGKLRVLKLKNVDFGDEKVEIGQLLELRYLRVCRSNLRTLPTDIIKLSKLEVLYLHDVDNNIKEVPEKTIGHLVELRKLALDLKYRTPTTQTATTKLHLTPRFDAVIVEVGYLSKLEILNMHLDTNIWYEKPEYPVDRVKRVFGQLCDSLRDLDMWAWPFAGPDELVLALEQLDKLAFLKIGGVKLPGVLIFPSGNFREFLPSLKTLKISRCYEIEKIEVSPRAFENIRELEISDCHSLKCIVGLEHLRSTLVKLTIEWCRMKELMTEVSLSFASLKYMELRELTYLQSICSDDVQFPSLTTFHLVDCPSLKKLPRGLMNEKKTLTECHIYDEDRKSWSGLRWQDDGFKSFIESTLIPYSRNRNGLSSECEVTESDEEDECEGTESDE